ncbi:MAG: DUF5615 family PIN-like protein [Bryobacterales bacterium]|nr:DUF5615 family PIN-like protein [Bryobacterales bacterium]MBV9400468.1 DUF5615 family PIN-like protein [Bryobacterales bacterium]
MGIPDSEVLRGAASSDRILVTHDRSTMPRHFGKFITHASSPGLIIVPQAPNIGEIIDDLLIVWAASEAKEWRNDIGFLPL